MPSLPTGLFVLRNLIALRTSSFDISSLSIGLFGSGDFSSVIRQASFVVVEMSAKNLQNASPTSASVVSSLLSTINFCTDL
jgi:hypothetical protein